MLVYRRLCEPAQRVSLHFMYSGSVVGKKMFPGNMAICDKPRDHGDGFTHHRLSATMGNGKVVTSQRYLWFNAGFASFLIWQRHPSMREYSTAGALMFQLWKYADRLDHPPDADASALEVWCALTLVYQWQGDKESGEKRGPLWWLFFGDLLTIGGIEDSLAGHHYTLNICCDLNGVEEGFHNVASRLMLKQQAISEDANEAVPFSTAAEGPWKSAIRSGTKRGTSIQKHYEGQDINRRGLFGDQFTEHDNRKRKKQKKAIKEAEEAPAVITLVSVQCWQCQESFETGVATDEYCPECLLDWAFSESSAEKQKRIDEEKAAAKIKKAAETKKIKKAAEKAAKKNEEEKAATKKANEKLAKKIKKEEDKLAKKKAEEDELKSNYDVVDETPAETDQQKPAVLEEGQVVQGCWEVEKAADTWEFGIVKSILWDEDPPKFGDPQWSYFIKWDDNTADQAPWHFNGEEWPMVSLRLPTKTQLRRRKTHITSDIDRANIFTRS